MTMKIQIYKIQTLAQVRNYYNNKKHFKMKNKKQTMKNNKYQNKKQKILIFNRSKIQGLMRESINNKPCNTKKKYFLLNK